MIPESQGSISDDAGEHAARHLSQYGGLKEVQAHLRHARATTTLDIYIKEIPAAVRTAVEKLDAILTSGDQDSEDNDVK